MISNFKNIQNPDWGRLAQSFLCLFGLSGMTKRQRYHREEGVKSVEHLL